MPRIKKLETVIQIQEETKENVVAMMLRMERILEEIKDGMTVPGHETSADDKA